MGKEIERKFLVVGSEYKSKGTAEHIQQGYIYSSTEKVVRIRTLNDKGFITVKGSTIGFSRNEWEYEIPIQDANELLKTLCEKPIIEKTRWVVFHENKKWEVDEFEGENKGLVVAEIELTDEKESITLPSWIGEEVTGIAKYYNSELLRNPFKKWK